MATRAQPNPWRFVLAGGLVAGALDLLYACVFWGLKAGVKPTRVFQSVAAGLLGAESFEGGAATAALGFGLHFFIAVTMSVAFYLVASRWRRLVERPILWGGIYGLCLYGVMNYVVVPLSRASAGSRDPGWIALSVAVHMALVGIPIALSARRALRR